MLIVQLQIFGLFFIVIIILDMLIVQLTCQGDGDYELVKDVLFDDFLRSRIKKVLHFYFTHWFKNLSACLLSETVTDSLLRSDYKKLLPCLLYTVFKLSP